MTRPFACEAVPRHHTHKRVRPLLRVVHLLLPGLHKVYLFFKVLVRCPLAACIFVRHRVAASGGASDQTREVPVYITMVPVEVLLSLLGHVELAILLVFSRRLPNTT